MKRRGGRCPHPAGHDSTRFFRAVRDASLGTPMGYGDSPPLSRCKEIVVIRWYEEAPWRTSVVEQDLPWAQGHGGNRRTVRMNKNNQRAAAAARLLGRRAALKAGAAGAVL